jgi:tetratricopeptide (TPR) repeat protein
MLSRLGPTRKRQLAGLVLVAALGIWGVVLVLQARTREARRHIDAGMAFVRLAQADNAEKEWQEAARLTPDNPAVWELLSELYINSEQWEKGTQALKHLLRTSPNHPFIYSRMAACALRSGQELEAQHLAQEELKRNPNDPASLTILAFLSEMQQDTDQQIVYLKRLEAIQPNDPDTLHDLVEAYYASGKYLDLLPIADRLVSIKPTDRTAYALRGAARFETDASPAAMAKAEADLLESLKIEPLSPFVRYTLGRLYLRERQYQKAVFQLELAQKLYPQKMDVYFDLATAYARVGQSEKAATARQRFEELRQEATTINVLQKQCALDKNNFDAHLKLGKLKLKYGDTRQALTYLQRALELRPNSVEAKAAFGQLKQELQKGPVSSR